MKKALAVLLTCSMVFSLAACGSKPADPAAGTAAAPASSEAAPATTEAAPAEPTGPVELNVVTSFAGNADNVQNYQDAIAAWATETGNTVSDASGVYDETMKARVLADFEVGAEPDVIFYFNGNDADPIVKGQKVVSIDEIRAAYPDYASNMNDDLIPASPADKVKYAVPMYGYWEGMFVNKAVLEKAGVAVPGADYTWDQFLADCEKIKAAGFAPIAATLANEPHYWFEFCIYNNQAVPSDHCTLPATTEDAAGKAWVGGIADIKDLYEKGFFNENTLSATVDEIIQLFIDDKAAFLVDGSWRTGGITEQAENIENFTVTYIPGKGERKASDIIGGLSSGWYITKKAWDDAEKRAAAVNFVQYMTSDELVSKFAQIAATALKNGVTIDESTLNSLQKDGVKMTKGATLVAAAVQDLVPQDCRTPIFNGMGNIVTGKVEIASAVQEVLDLLEAAKAAPAE